MLHLGLQKKLQPKKVAHPWKMLRSFYLIHFSNSIQLCAGFLRKYFSVLRSRGRHGLELKDISYENWLKLRGGKTIS